MASESSRCKSRSAGGQLEQPAEVKSSTRMGARDESEEAAVNTRAEQAARAKRRDIVTCTSRSSVFLGFDELVNRGLPGGVPRGRFHLRTLGYLVGRLKLALVPGIDLGALEFGRFGVLGYRCLGHTERSAHRQHQSQRQSAHLHVAYLSPFRG